MNRLWVTIEDSNCNLRFLFRKDDSKSVLVVHYHRIGYLSFSSELFSFFLILSFYSKNSTEIRLTVQFSIVDGKALAVRLSKFLQAINPVTSYYILQNKIEYGSALKRQKYMNSHKWSSFKEKFGIMSTSKSPPQTNRSQYISLQLANKQTTEDVLSKSCLIQRSFPTQQQAIDFIDHYRDYDHDIKLFSYERIGDKKRQFAALTKEEFHWEYERKSYKQNPLQHCYEIIREYCPCKLYMDVEFLYRLNPNKDGIVLLGVLIKFISYCLFYVFGIHASSDDFSCIFSQNQDKFSCHVILNKNQILFRNNIHLGRFMQWAVDSLKQNTTSEYFVLFLQGESKEVFMADMAVYTKNRAMRLMRSSKHSKDHKLSYLNTAFSLKVWQLYFPYTIITEYLFYQKPYRLLYYKTVSKHKSVSKLLSTASMIKTSQFPLPSLSHIILSSWESISHIKSGFIRSWCCYGGKMGGWKLRLEVGGNRWCMNKNRQHKSNHIFFIVDLWRGIFYQKCHDSECSQYLSPFFLLPSNEVEDAIIYFDLEMTPL